MCYIEGLNVKIKNIEMKIQMNKRFLFVVISLLLVFTSAHAQLFWKVSGNGLQKASYLFGTHHAIDKKQIKDFDKIYAISGQTDAVVGELDMNDSTLQSKMIQGAMMDSTIKDLLSTKDYLFVDKEFKQLIGAGMDKMGHFKPALISTVYSMKLYLKEMGLDKEPEAVDRLFQNNARANGKIVIPLETPEFQIDILFNTLPLKRQAEMLVKDVKEKRKDIRDVKKMNAFYLAGDMAKMEKLDKKDNSMTPAEHLQMVDNRNVNWLKQLPSLMSSQSCFVAVGFLHLVGEKGLVSNLKKVGYTVEPMAF